MQTGVNKVQVQKIKNMVADGKENHEIFLELKSVNPEVIEQVADYFREPVVEDEE